MQWGFYAGCYSKIYSFCVCVCVVVVVVVVVVGGGGGGVPGHKWGCILLNFYESFFWCGKLLSFVWSQYIFECMYFCCVVLYCAVSCRVVSCRVMSCHVMVRYVCHLVVNLNELFVKSNARIQDHSEYGLLQKRRCYYVAPSLISWATTQSNPCVWQIYPL